MDREAYWQKGRWGALTTNNLSTQIAIIDGGFKMYLGRTTEVKNAIFIKSFSAIKLH